MSNTTDAVELGGTHTLPFWTRHEGPYRLYATRPHPSKPGWWTGGWLKGEIRHGQDVQEEALALLADPRDNIAFINVWSVGEEAYVGGYRR